MKPFLRPVDRGQLAPVGWEAEPAGLWKDQEVDVVYDPRRHRVLMVRGELEPGTETALRSEGWRRQNRAGENSLWVCDDIALARERTAPGVVEIGQPGPQRPGPEPPDLGGIA